MTKTEVQNYSQMKIAHLHNKFWAPNSVEVPNAGIVINEDFVDIDNVLRIPEQISHFKVFWVTKGISGTICVPGQWNYAYIDGKFYHLTKGDSNGFIEGVEEEWFYYNVTYDDWQNDWMKNRVYLKGTIDLTGDQELVKQNIHQIAPLLENVNGRRFLDGLRKVGDEAVKPTVLKLPEKLSPELQAKTQFTVWERIEFNKHLQEGHERIKANPELAKPVEDHLVIPLLYRLTKSGNWKNAILKAIKIHADAGLLAHDVIRGSDAGQDAQAARFRNLMQNLLHSDTLYALASKSNRVYVHARAINPSIYVEEVDLSGCTDITLLDGMTLTKRYTLDNPEPKFSLDKFIDWFVRVQEWNSDLKDQMKTVFQEEFIKAFGKILASGGMEDNKVFRDVTMEKIQRDVVYTELSPNKESIMNPAGLSWTDSRIIGEHRHKNFIWDHTDGLNMVHDFLKFNDIFNQLPNTQKNEIKDIYRKFIEDPQASVSKIQEDYRMSVNIIGTQLLNSNFIYLPDKYKMVSKDDKSEYLDFSYNYNDKDCEGIAVTPDYDRNTHVISLLNRRSNLNSVYGNTYKYNQKNTKHRERKDDNGKPVSIGPVIFREILNQQQSDAVIDGQKPSTELLKVYKTLGRNNEHKKNSDGTWDYNYRTQPTPLRDAGAEILSRGYAFMALQTDINSSFSGYTLRNDNGNSTTNDIHNYKQSDYSSAQRPECVYTDEKREWRRFHTEMTFPVKTDGFSIIDKLREFDDIPDNFLRWEVINTNIKKGKITKYMRSYVGAWNNVTKKRNNNAPGAYRLRKEEEEKIPKNTVVSIYICLRQSYSPEGDAAFDKKAADEYQTKYGRSGYTRMGELLYGLCRYYFLTPGEDRGEYGAIPDWIKVYGEPDYPPNGDGRSQIGLSWMKPHQGRWYVAWTRFFAPAIYHSQPLRVMDNRGNLFPMMHKGKPSNDFIAAYIQKNYDDSANYPPQYAYRKHSSDVDMNTLIAFYYGNLTPPGRLSYSSGGTKREDGIKNVGNTTNDPNSFPTYAGKVNPHGDEKEPHNLYGRLGTNYPYRLSEGYKGLPYEGLLYEWRQYLMGWNTLILDNFIKNAKTYKTRRLDNPKEIPNTFKDPIEIKTFTAFESEIPPFMVHYLDPEDPLCVLHKMVKNPMIRTNEQRLQLLREKLGEMFRAATEMMETWGVFMKFDGTNWYANMQLNTKDMVWDFELFCDEPHQFKERGHEKWNFINHKEEDIDVIINTRNVLNTYGTQFNFKSRWYSTEDELDLGLAIKPLLDQKQTIAAQWYSVSMKYNEQDVIEEIIETPKEMTAYAGYNNFDKEKMVREFGMMNAEYMFKKQMLEIQKSENKINDQYEKDMQWYEWKYGVIGGAMDMVVGLGDMAVGGIEAVLSATGIQMKDYKQGFQWGTHHGKRRQLGMMYDNKLDQFKDSFSKPYSRTYDVMKNPYYHKYTVEGGSEYGATNRRMAHYTAHGASTFAKGLKTVAEGGMNIGRAYDLWYAKDPRRQEMFNLTNKKLLLEGDHVNARHEHDRATLLREIWETSANVAFPQLNSALVYKEHNKERKLKDVHIVQYYPRGKLADYLKNYYKEFGYQIIVRNFECTGVDSIKTHLRYQFVYENVYNDVSIKSMIGLRAMNGIKVIPWIQ